MEAYEELKKQRQLQLLHECARSGKNKQAWSIEIGKNRWVVERAFAWFRRNRYLPI